MNPQGLWFSWEILRYIRINQVEFSEQNRNEKLRGLSRSCKKTGQATQHERTEIAPVKERDRFVAPEQPRGERRLPFKIRTGLSPRNDSSYLIRESAMKYAWVIHIFVLLAIILCSISPFFGVAYAGAVTEKYGCELNEGSIHPCMVNGVDRGEDLYAQGMLGWLGIASVPLGLAALVLYIVIVLIIFLVIRLRKKSVAQTPVP